MTPLEQRTSSDGGALTSPLHSIKENIAIAPYKDKNCVIASIMSISEESTYQFIVFSIWSVFTISWGLMAVLYINSNASIKAQKSFFGGLFLTGSIGLYCYITDLGTIQVLSQFRDFGIAIMLAGFFIALWGRVYLGRSWSLDAKSYSNGIITNGPYRYSRHPIYAGQLLMCFGNSLTASNYYVFIFTFIGTYVFQYRRSLKEESILRECYPEQYNNYSTSKPRFILKFK